MFRNAIGEGPCGCLVGTAQIYVLESNGDR